MVSARQTGCGCANTRGIGWDFVHVAIDDATHIAFAEIQPDERKVSAEAFHARALRWMSARGIGTERVMTDNSSTYRPKCFAAVLRGLGVRHFFTRPYMRRTNGKTEHFMQTLLRECA